MQQARETYGGGGDVGEIGGNAWGVDNIVEGELIDERGSLEKEGQWLQHISDPAQRAIRG
jgi:hypothetical protein